MLKFKKILRNNNVPDICLAYYGFKDEKRRYSAGIIISKLSLNQIGKIKKTYSDDCLKRVIDTAGELYILIDLARLNLSENVQFHLINTGYYFIAEELAASSTNYNVLKKLSNHYSSNVSYRSKRRLKTLKISEESLLRTKTR